MQTAPPIGLPPLRELHTRFVFPFFFDPTPLARSVQTLEQATVIGLPNPGRRVKVWSRAEAPELYKGELLEHAEQFLFACVHENEPESGSTRPQCAYLRVGNDAINLWFRDGDNHVRLKKELVVRFRRIPAIGIELFLSNFGAGVLSIGLDLADLGEDTARALAFNYRVARLQSSGMSEVFLPHPQDDPERWQRLDADARARVEPKPAIDSPLAARLGHRGGAYFLSELVEELLRPLEALGMAPFESKKPDEEATPSSSVLSAAPPTPRRDATIQSGPAAAILSHVPQFNVYTVARFGEGADLALPAVRDAAGIVVSGLAQIEEPEHAGSLPGEPGVPNEILNRRHWAAVSLYGAAHVIADQPPLPDGKELPFNEQRTGRVRDRYFMAYLVALLEKMFLDRTVAAAGQLSQMQGEPLRARAMELRQEMLRYGVSGRFVHVSRRHAIHRFYELCRAGMDLADGWNDCRQEIGDLEARVMAEEQQRVEQDRLQNLAIVAHTQTMAEWIEVFLVSIYFAHLWHMLTHGNHYARSFFGLGDSPHDMHVFEAVVFYGTAVTALLAGSIAFVVLKPFKHRVRHGRSYRDSNHDVPGGGH